MVPGRSLGTDDQSQNWQIGLSGIHTAQNTSFLDAPIEPSSSVYKKQHQKSTASRSSIDSMSSVVGGKSTLEPVLSSKREYISKEGHPKTEYVWRHPPVFETSNGQTQFVFQGVERFINGEQRGRQHNFDSAPSSPTTPRQASGIPPYSPPHGHVRHTSNSSNLRSEYTGLPSPSSPHDNAQVSRPFGNRSSPSIDGGSRKPVGGSIGQAISTNEGGYQSGNGGEATATLRRMRERRSASISRDGNSSQNGTLFADAERNLQNLHI